MRGKLGSKLTIYGDWLYDWAKFYQSIIGYDNILLSNEIDLEYQKSMVDCFCNYFIELYCQDDLSNLKMITKSLLFSLIPLHNNHKCQKYYSLINSQFLN